MSRVILACLAAVVLGMVGWAVWNADRTPSVPEALTLAGKRRSGEPAVFLEDQETGSASVMVGYAVLPQPGFVAIYENEGGVPGPLIGVSARLEEAAEHIPVQLKRPLSGGQVYFAMLMADDGDGQFDPPQDRPFLGSEGEVTAQSFQAREGARPESGAVAP